MFVFQRVNHVTTTLLCVNGTNGAVGVTVQDHVILAIEKELGICVVNKTKHLPNARLNVKLTLRHLQSTARAFHV